jgi:hypothetical protein
MSDVDFCSAEDVYSLMGMTGTKRISPQKSCEAVSGEDEGGGCALGTGGQFPVRVRGGVSDPCAEEKQPR